jgi:hypothetical protein
MSPAARLIQFPGDREQSVAGPIEQKAGLDHPRSLARGDGGWEQPATLTSAAGRVSVGSSLQIVPHVATCISPPP